MVVTGAIPNDRIVTEINAEPAAQEYLRLAGHAGEALGVAFYAAHPLMVRAGGDYHVRSIQSANPDGSRSEEHTSELQSLMRTSYDVFCLKKKNDQTQKTRNSLLQYDRTTQ